MQLGNIYLGILHLMAYAVISAGATVLAGARARGVNERIRNYLLCNNDTMRKATRNLGQLYDDVLAQSGLRNSQFGLLVHIDELDEPTVKILARELVMDISALGHSLKPLIRDGFVRLVPNTDDGRSKRVTLTKTGQRKVADTMGLWLSAQRRVEKIVGCEKARRLREAMVFLASEEFSTAFIEFDKAEGTSLEL